MSTTMGCTRPRLHSIAYPALAEKRQADLKTWQVLHDGRMRRIGARVIA